MMRKPFLCAGLVFLLASPLAAATDAKTAEFLLKVNQYYYCLSKEGLKGFSGQFGMDITEAFKDYIRQKNGNTVAEKEFQGMKTLRFNLSADSQGKSSVHLVPLQPTGDPNIDKWLAGFAGGMEKTVGSIFEFWNDIMFTPLTSRSDLDKYRFLVTTNPDGFKVDMQKDSETDTTVFDRQAKLTSLYSVVNGQTVATITPEFAPSPKGFVLSGALFNVGGRSIKCQFDFQAVDRYWLPKNVTVVITEGVNYVKGEGFIFTLLNTQLQQ